jgi:HD-GYP domain-containing protein (c-di-GMP phosphodiesterase class II)
MITLQMRLDALARTPVTGAGQDPKEMAALLERDRAKQKSLQQRLEQLVAVHRQLLRKFGTLELENVELKKKTILREERIKQLEDNSRTLVSNVRLQAEKHLAEVAIFREQISIMKIEFEKQYENARQAEEMMMSGVPPGGNATGAMNNGALANVTNHNATFFGGSGRSPNLVQRAMFMNRNMQPKSIRGGGVGGKSFYVNNSANVPNQPPTDDSSTTTSPSIGSGNNYNTLAATLSPSAMMSRYQSFTFGHHNATMTPSTTTTAVTATAKSTVNAPNNINNTTTTTTNNALGNSGGVASTTTMTTTGASTPGTPPLMLHMEEPKSMGLAARLLGSNK